MSLTQFDVAKSRKRLERDYYEVSGWEIPNGFGVNSPKFGSVAIRMMRRINIKEFPKNDPDVWTKELTQRILEKTRPPVTPLGVAKSFIGGIETLGNNKGPKVTQVQLATELPPGPWPYCAAGVGFCLRESGWNKWDEFLHAELEAWVPGWVDSARNGRHGLHVIERNLVLPNDLICFNWAGVAGPARDYDHIGLVRTKPTSNITGTREFNTGPGAGGNQSDGDGCWDRQRPYSDGDLYIRGSWNH